MPAILLKRLAIALAASSAVLLGVLPLHADNKHHYPEAGTVISVATTDQGHVYTIETGGRIKRVECVKANLFQSTPSQCEVSGRPVAVNDSIHFRLDDIDDDIAYIPANGDREEKLLILSTELKVLPPLPPPLDPSAGESCAVLGIGKDLVERQYTVSLGSSAAPLSGMADASITAPATSASPVMPAGPVTAVPVTGGPPVPVIATAPVTGGVITGVSVTGGPPVTAVPVAPVTGTPTSSTTPPDSVLANANSTSTTTTVGESEWVHFLRVQTEGRVYKLACPTRYCWLNDRAPQLGDLLTIRIKGNAAYISWRPPGPKGKHRFAILSVSQIDYRPATPSH